MILQGHLNFLLPTGDALLLLGIQLIIAFQCQAGVLRYVCVMKNEKENIPAHILKKIVQEIKNG
ncbi:MAG: hypothetical protein D3917_06575 [Candidatus Electrothrix sp. AX5]|nr:hypothetical protein [Candidatus Electrothrix sp. AX5]